MAEVSVPKMIFANNVRMVTESEVRRALDAISVFVTTVTGVEFDARRALVTRADFCFNFRVGERFIVRYIEHLTGCRLPHLGEPIPMSRTSLRWQNKQRMVKVYGKHAQARADSDAVEVREAAKGLLRLEVSILGYDALCNLARWSGFDDRYAEDLLTLEVADYVLRQAMGALRLNQEIVSFDARREAVLNATGGGTDYQKARGFLDLLDEHSEQFWRIPDLKYSRSSYHRYAKVCRAAKVWRGRASDEMLPALSLTWCADDDAETPAPDPSRQPVTSRVVLSEFVPPERLTTENHAPACA